MNLNWLANKFWVEVVGIVLSLCAAIITASAGKPDERAEKIAAALFIAGLFFAVLRSRYDVLKELKEYKDIAERTKEPLIKAPSPLERG